MNDTYIGGQVRQHGNLSFTRVYEAGHEVPAYQPETAFRIFQRALFNMDIATGKVSTIDHPNHSTQGPSDISNITNKPIVDPGSQCYILDRDQCTKEQWETVKNGTAWVKNWIVVDANTSVLFPDLSNGTSSHGSKPSLPVSTGGGSATAAVEGISRFLLGAAVAGFLVANFESLLEQIAF